MYSDWPTIFLIDEDISSLRTYSAALRLAEYSVEAIASAEEYLKRDFYQGTGCIVSALHMQGMSGLDLQQCERSRGSSLPFIFMTNCGEIRCAVRALKEGAVDVLVTPPFAELITAVETAISLHRRTLEAKQQRAQYEDKFQRLTPKEREVCLRVRRGLLNKQIAWELDASEKTVKLHRARVMRKLNVTSVPELVDLLRVIGAA